jgi:hypothetical protein
MGPVDRLMNDAGEWADEWAFEYIKNGVMKKIGILFGQERSFPTAFIEAVNRRNIGGIVAEPVYIDKVAQGEPCGYDVIIDRISQDVPFYRAYLTDGNSGHQ